MRGAPLPDCFITRCGPFVAGVRTPLGSRNLDWASTLRFVWQVNECSRLQPSVLWPSPAVRTALWWYEHGTVCVDACTPVMCALKGGVEGSVCGGGAISLQGLLRLQLDGDDVAPGL